MRYVGVHIEMGREVSENTVIRQRQDHIVSPGDVYVLRILVSKG